jgi:hypothetical protein
MDQDNEDDSMHHNVRFDYLKVFERSSDEPSIDLPVVCSPSSCSSSPSPTQQFDIGSFFDKSVEPKQLFELDMPENELHMFMSPVASLPKRHHALKGIFRSCLIREGHGHLLVANVPGRRVRTKSSHPELCIRRLLHADCKEDTAPSGLHRKNGMQEAMRCVSTMLNVPFKLARMKVRLVWNTLPKVQRNLWTVKKGLTLKTMVFDKGIGWRRKDDAIAAECHRRYGKAGLDSIAVTALGFIATWFPNIGQDHPAVVRWVQEGLREDELKEKLLTLSLFKTHFEAFNGWVRKLGETFSSCAPACSMEMCYNGKSPCQIHLHAFFGPEVTFRGWARKPVEMCPTWKQLQWNGVLPHLEPMRGHGVNGIERATRRGLYYITMDKVGLLFRASKVWPHEDGLYQTLAWRTSSSFVTSKATKPSWIASLSGTKIQWTWTNICVN